jgi:hypothetical protein
MGIVFFEVVEEYRDKLWLIHPQVACVVCRTPIYPGVVAMIFYPVVFRGEFFLTCITNGCLSIIFNVFGGHLDRFFEFEPVVDITGFLLKKVYKLFGNVFSLILLGVVY